MDRFNSTIDYNYLSFIDFFSYKCPFMCTIKHKKLSFFKKKVNNSINLYLYSSCYNPDWLCWGGGGHPGAGQGVKQGRRDEEVEIESRKRRVTHIRANLSGR